MINQNNYEILEKISEKQLLINYELQRNYKLTLSNDATFN